MGILDKLFGKQTRATQEKNLPTEEGKCPGCGLDLSKLLFTSEGAPFLCPSCNSDLTSHVTVLNLSAAEQDGDFTEFVLYENLQFGFSFEYPRSWNEDTSGGGLVIYPEYAKGQFVNGGHFLFLPAISITIGEYAKTNASEFYRKFLAKQPDNFENYKLSWERSRKLQSGEEALEWSFSFTRSPLNLTSVSTLALKQNKIFLLNADCLSSQITDLEPLFCRVVESLSLAKKGTQS